MKWINLWIKTFGRLYLHKNCLQFNTTTVILHKSNIHQEVKEKNILKCLCPHVGCVAP